MVSVKLLLILKKNMDIERARFVLLSALLVHDSTGLLSLLLGAREFGGTFLCLFFWRGSL